MYGCKETLAKAKLNMELGFLPDPSEQEGSATQNLETWPITILPHIHFHGSRTAHGYIFRFLMNTKSRPIQIVGLEFLK